MPRIAIPLHSAESDNPQASRERLLNLYAEKAPPSAKSKVILRGAPGYTSHSTVAHVTGLYNANGSLYAATDSKLYRILSDGSYSEKTATGTFGSERTSISWNGTDFFVQADDGCCFIDGYFIRHNGGGQIGWSNVYTTTFDPLDFATAEGAPDDIIGMAAVHRELWLFGRHTTEIWYNSGDIDQTFTRINSAFIEYGASGGIATLDNTIFWLGDDNIAYTANGYLPVRISTHEIEKKIAAATGTPLAWTYHDSGHGFYVLRFDDLCVVFDTQTGLWHERAAYKQDSIPYTCYARCFGKHFVGGPGGVFEMSNDIYEDHGRVIEREFITPPIFTDETRQWSTCSSLELLLETGKGLTTGQGSDPQVMLQMSNDGRTWGNQKWRSAGEIGEYGTRVRWLRNGRFRERHHKFRMSDPVKWSIIGLNAEVR